MARPRKGRPTDPSRRIPTEWFHGLDPDEQEAVERTWRNSTYLTDKLKAIIDRKIADLEIDKTDDYNNPQWPVLRADRNGQLQSLMYIKKLLP